MCRYKMVESVRNICIVLFIGVIFVVQSFALVCPYSDQICMCDSDEIICYNQQEIPPVNTGVNVTRIGTLIFQNGNISSISKNNLPPGLTTIELFNNPLTNISDDAFDASAATLHSIKIRGAKFTSLPTALKKLTTLTVLDIGDTVIQYWDAATLKQIAATLAILRLSNVGLSSWPSWISDFNLLQIINLSWNSLTSIPDDAFSSIKDTLVILDLSGTGLTHVPHALSILSTLTSLNLGSINFIDVPEIDKITASPFAHTLGELYLDSAGLTRTANFSNLTSLVRLRLSGNRISDVPAGSLPASLKELDLSGNSLSSVPQAVASLSGLSYLDLFGNLITGIEPNTFPPSLTSLDLSSNNITIITNSTFRNLNFLVSLRLNNNPISTISPSAFTDLASLQSLYLRDSNLTDIPLAFTLLSPHIAISLTTTQSLSCPCPTPQELVQWFASLIYNWITSDICSSGQLVHSYLSGQCGQPTATP